MIKKITLTFSLLLAGALTLQAQNTSPLPTTGKVGIGTLSPSGMLQVKTNAGTTLAMEIGPSGNHHSYVRLDRQIGYDGGILFTENRNLKYQFVNHDNDNFGIYSYTAADWVFNIQATTGNIGIGTMTPNAKLEVTGGNIAGNSAVIAKGNNAVWTDAATFIDYNTANGYGRVGAYDFATASWKNLVIEGGNVGIGTTNPGNSALQIQGNGTNVAHVLLKNPNNNNLGIQFGYTSNNSNNAEIWQWENSFFRIGTNNAERLRVAANGHVGIGTTSPGEKLEVNGNARIIGEIYSKRVKVSTNASNWPDYVFEPNYQLRSLAETEAFIKANKHLPEVPSAKEIEENGQDLGDVQAILLKKIEEMTLRMIEMNKRLEKLEKENEALKGEDK